MPVIEIDVPEIVIPEFEFEPTWEPTWENDIVEPIIQEICTA